MNDKNYELVVKVWETFKMNTMKDYHILHLKVDISLLALVLETFRNESINFFELNKLFIYF